MDNINEVTVGKVLQKLQRLLDKLCESRYSSQSSKRKLLETLDKLHKYSRKSRLSRQIISDIEEAIYQSKLRCERHHDADDFVDLTREPDKSKKYKHKKRKRHGKELKKRKKDRSRKRTSTYYRRSQNAVSTVSYSRYSPSQCSNTISDDEESLSSDDSFNGYRESGAFYKHIRRSDSQYSRRYSNRHVDRSPVREEIDSPRRHNSRRDSRSRSRSRFSDDDTYKKQTKHRSRSRSSERCKSKSRSKRRRRASPYQRYKRSRSSSRRRSRRSRSRRSTSVRRNKRTTSRRSERSTSRRSERSTSRRSERSTSRRRYTPSTHRRHSTSPLVKYSPERLRNELPNRRNGFNDGGSRCGTKTFHDSQNYSESKALAENFQSHSVESSSHNYKSDEVVALGHNRFDVNCSNNVPHRLNVKTEAYYQSAEKSSTSDNDLVFKNLSNCLSPAVQSNNLDVALRNPFKDDKLKVNTFDSAKSNTLTNVRSKLSMLLKSTLNSRLNDGTPCQISTVHEMSEERNMPSEVTPDNKKTPKETNSFDSTLIDDSLVDDEIIQKIISQPIKDTFKATSFGLLNENTCKTSAYERAANFTFEVDLVQRAITRAKMTDNERISDAQCSEIASEKNSIVQLAPTNPSKAQAALSETDTQWNVVTDIMKSSNRTQIEPTSSCFPSTSVNLPIPQMKFSSNPFKAPLLPQQNDFSSKTNIFNIPVGQQKNKIVQRRATVFIERNRLPGKYGASKTPQLLSKGFKIPKISKPTTCSTSHNETIRQGNKLETANVIVIDDDVNKSIDVPTSKSNDAMNQHYDHSTVKENVLDEVGENPPRQENAMTSLKDFMNTKQFATLVELMGQMAQQVVLNKSANEVGGSGSSTSSSVWNNLMSAGESSRTATVIRQQKTTKATLTRSRSLSPTNDSSIEMTKMDSNLMEARKFKNVDKKWHSLTKVLSCQACSKPHGNSIVSHYVNKHPDHEVLVSRLPPEAADSLRSGKSITECKIVRKDFGKNGYACNQYQQFCYFCNIYKSFSRSLWIHHIARHTGYYTQKCNHCSKLFASKPHHKGICADINDFSAIPQPQFDKGDIKAYVCNLCNFVRLQQHEIEKHLTVEHDTVPDNKFQQFVFVRLSKDGPSVRVRGPRGPYRKRSRAVDDFLANLSDAESEEKGDVGTEYNEEYQSEESDSEYETGTESTTENSSVSEWESGSELQDDDIKIEISDFGTINV